MGYKQMLLEAAKSTPKDDDSAFLAALELADLINVEEVLPKLTHEVYRAGLVELWAAQQLRELKTMASMALLDLREDD